MGNREALLAGAKRCLSMQGWARTTVRDIAREAGVSHAAIGYHYGSREALLVAALFQATEELGRQIERDLADGAGPADRWQELLATFGTHRALWVAQIEALSQAQYVPSLREQLTQRQRLSREAFGGAGPLAVLLGLMIQSLIDPDSTTGVEQLGLELESLGRQLTDHSQR